MKLHWKVCGMSHSQNITEVLTLEPNYMGFIFYQKSARYVGDTFKLPSIAFTNTQKVGVFVNHSIDFIFSQVVRYQLDTIQLHGDENVDFCAAIKSPILRGARDIPNHVKTIKAFGISADFNFTNLVPYLPHCDYFLFDTQTKNYGGSGQTFDWKILQSYPFDTPIFLSGGISCENLPEVLKFIKAHQQIPIIALDINSKFEISPALKNFELLRQFKHILEEA